MPGRSLYVYTMDSDARNCRILTFTRFITTQGLIKKISGTFVEKEDKNRQKKANLCSLLLKLYIVWLGFFWCFVVVVVVVVVFWGGEVALEMNDSVGSPLLLCVSRCLQSALRDSSKNFGL